MEQKRPTYLLDTNAVFCLKRELLERLSLDGYDLCASPYVFWERLCHLDKKEFERAKGEYAKFDFVKILDDPRMAVEARHVPKTVDLRAGRANILYSALKNLKIAKSLEKFYTSKIYVDGQARQITGCAESIREDLEGRETRYVKFLEQIATVITRDHAFQMTVQEKHKCILGLAEGYIKDIERQGGTPNEAEKHDLINNIYVYFSFIFHRALCLIVNGHDFATRSKKLMNDYEDSRISLHFKLDEPYCLVTMERSITDTLKGTTTMLQGLADPRFPANVETCSPKELPDRARGTE